MGEDAAAAARRIVEEVLAARGTPSGAVSDAPAGRGPEAGTGDVEEAVSDPAAGDRDTGTPASAARPEPPRGEEAAERSAALSEAERIARRIVDEVLAAEADVRVHGVPREGLPADDERTAKIVVDPEPGGETTQRVPGGSGASAAGSEDPTGPDAGGSQAPPDQTPGQQVAATASPAAGAEDEPTSDPDSAQDIVRRIVADVQAGAQPAPAADIDDETSETVQAGAQPAPAADIDDETSETVHLPATPPERTSPEQDDAGGSPGTVELPVGMTERSGDPATAIAEEEGTTRVVSRSGQKREAPSESASGPVALADDAESGSGRSLVGWAPPPEPEPTPPAVAEEPAPRTMRWLLASLLGAVALAVLFPLAVAALRALVSL